MRTPGVLQHGETVRQHNGTAQWLQNVRPIDFQPRHGGLLGGGNNLQSYEA